MGDTRRARYKLVERYVVHDGCEPLADRVTSLLPRDVHYVVLDLDRTVHLGVTIGERLGWEICADPACEPGNDGPAALFDARAPLHSARCAWRGLRSWGPAGLLYAVTVRLGDRSQRWHRMLMTSVGPAYVERVQSLLRAVLMARAADYGRAELERFCERAWRRWEGRLVVDAGVIAAIRRACPALRGVLLSSASTAPTVEHAAAKLGVDGFVSSAVDVVADGERDVYSAPAGLPAGLRRARPLYFSRPGAVVHNAAAHKVSLLRVYHPEVFAPGVVSVGITDNNYGEDRTWSDHFTHVIALNSLHPFSPFVAADSPCESLQIVDARPAGTPTVSLGKRLRWHGTLRASAYDRDSLAACFEQSAFGRRLESLVDQLRAARERAACAVDASVRTGLASAGAGLTDAVERYNTASAKQKAAIGREMARLARSARRMRARLERAGRECAHIQHELERAHVEAASVLVARGPDERNEARS